MRHTVTLLIGPDLKPFTARLGQYVLKYGEADASPYFMSLAWTCADGRTEVKKAVRDGANPYDFVPDLADQYRTRLDELKTLTGADRSLDMRHFFQELHQQTVTIAKPGDSNSLLLSLVVPLYDERACDEAIGIIRATSDIPSHYTVMVIGLSAHLGGIISPEPFRDVTADDEAKKKEIQKQTLQSLAEQRLGQNTLEQVIVMQNSNSEGYALNLDRDSLVRILGELALTFVERHDTVFTPAGILDREHPATALGLSVMSLDKYYFKDYLLRRAYLSLLEREGVTDEEVDLNKVAGVANARLARHHRFFSDFYEQTIAPLQQQGTPPDAIIAQTAGLLDARLGEIADDLTSYLHDPQYTLPEKQGILAMVLGYDDALLKDYLFPGTQLTIDNLDAEVAGYFIDANNACVSKHHSADPAVGDHATYGPLGDLCADDDGRVSLPIDRLQRLRTEIRQSTNYIRGKSKELDAIGAMTQDAADSRKRLTENGFVIDGSEYRFDVRHDEARFDETYEPKEVRDKSVSLKEYFTQVKDQGQIGACTVFAISSIYEYILKRNTDDEADLSESFVYYNVRHQEGKELEDTGSSFQDVIASIGRQGICTESLHPYTHALGDAPSDEAYRDGATRRITKALNVNVALDDIRSAIQEGYPVAISLKVFDSFDASTGFVRRPTYDEMETADFGYHAMVVVGYSDDTKFFLVRNSWGEHFGDKGYCYIPYSYVSDPRLNRMACIVTEVCYQDGVLTTAGGGPKGTRQTVQFLMSDAAIKTRVIRNLIDEEQVHLKEMQQEDERVRTDYERLIQTLGKQSVRTQVMEARSRALAAQIDELKKKLAAVTATGHPHPDQTPSPAMRYMIASAVILAMTWGLLARTELTLRERAFTALGVLLVLLILFWPWAASQRHGVAAPLADADAADALSAEIRRLQRQAEELEMKTHIAGMVIDRLLSVKARVHETYHGVKAYVGNLALWHQEEEKRLGSMEPLVKDPFIPLLSNDRLRTYFEDNKESITQGLCLYETFKGLRLDDKAIVDYKRRLKQDILARLDPLLSDFSVSRHILGIRDYPYLDKGHASAGALLPVLDTKSAPFCQIRETALTQRPARILFIHTDPAEQPAWNAAYPQHFITPPTSDDIASVYKIVELRVQRLTLDEVILD